MAKATQEYPTKQSDDFGTVLGSTFQLITESWGGLLLNLKTFALLLVAAIVSVVIFSALLLGPTGLMMANDASTVTVNVTSIVAGIVGLVGIVLVALVLTTAITLTTLASARNKVLEIRSALSESQKLLPQVFLLSILVVIAVILGFLLLIIPGFLAIFFLSFAVYVLVDKKCTPIEAIKESYELTKRNWKIILSYFIVSFAIQIPAIVPVLGDLVTFVLSIAYLCLPAILYVRMQKQNPVKK